MCSSPKPLGYMLSVQSTTGKTYGRTASGEQITDDLIDALAKKAEAGYGIVELTEVREDVCRIAAAHGAGNVRLFGSTGSDELEELLGVRVDVVTETSLSPYVRDRVLDEAVAL